MIEALAASWCKEERSAKLEQNQAIITIVIQIHGTTDRKKRFTFDLGFVCLIAKHQKAIIPRIHRAIHNSDNSLSF